MRRIVQQIAFVAAFFLLAAGTIPVAAQSIVYVDDDAAPFGDGASWTTAYRFLQDALTDTEWLGKPVEIRVAQGLYKPDQSATTRKGSASGIETFYLFDELTLQGGYAGIAAPDPNARDVDAYATILSGDLEDNDLPIPAEVFRRDMPADRIDNVTHVVTVRGDVTIDGFTIRGGRYSIIPRGDSTGGAGMLLGGHEVKVANCTFRDNATTTGSGGAVYVGPVCHAEFIDCTFSNNYGSKGGALYCRWGSVDLYGCEFTQNYAPSSGGALGTQSGRVFAASCKFIRNSSGATDWWSDGNGGAVVGQAGATLEFEDSVFIGNTAMSLGGAVFGDVHSAALTCRNSLFAGNLAGIQGGAVAAGSVSLTNCTIAGNRAAGNPEISVEAGGLSELFNCIVWNNEKLSPESPNDSDWLGTCFYCCLDPNAVATRDLGNIDQDPAFAVPGYWDPNGTPDDPSDDVFVEGDYHLKSQAGRWDPDSRSWVADDVTSPCIDAGDPNAPLRDEPIPNGGIINMGAYGGTAEASMSPLSGPTEGQWTAPARLERISSDLAEEWSPTLLDDGLTMYFVRVHSPISEYGRIFQARRLNTSESFGSIGIVPSPLNTFPGHILCLWISPDQLRMYYMLQVDGRFTLEISERSSTRAFWPVGADLWELNRFGRRLAAPYLTADERTIFFSASDINGTLGGYDIWTATRADKEARFGEPFAIESINTTFNEVHSFITGDGLTMYFASDRNGRYQLFRSSRADLDSPFGSPVHMPLFDTPDGDSRFPCLSADGTEFYFQRETDQDRSTRDIWVSYRID